MNENLTDEFAILMNVENTIKADLIISILIANEIPSYKSYQSSGEYLNIAAGYNYQGITIIVPKILLNKAREIIKEMESEVQQENFMDMTLHEVQEFDELGKKFISKRKRILRLILLMVLIVPLLFSLLCNLLK